MKSGDSALNQYLAHGLGYALFWCACQGRGNAIDSNNKRSDAGGQGVRLATDVPARIRSSDLFAKSFRISEKQPTPSDIVAAEQHVGLKT